MPFFKFRPNPEDMVASGFRAVAHVPCIFSSAGEYVDAVSRYLRERALLEWAPRERTFNEFVTRRYPTKKSLENYADWLVNFLDWLEYRGLRWQTARYTEDLVYGYQEDMSKGSWSASGEPLAASTINARVEEACTFLRWAADRALRGPFHIITTTTVYSRSRLLSDDGRKGNLVVTVRAGRVRPSPKNFDLPCDEAVKRWHSVVRARKGYTKALICELILHSGIRREEAAEWRIDTLPAREKWKVVGDAVVVTVKYGAKGPKQTDANGEEYGPERTIAVPMVLAQKLDHYRTFVRPRSRAQYARRAESKEERQRRTQEKERRLFISEATGERISAQTIYDAWTINTDLPFVGWSPHMGRHYWACKHLLKLLKADLERLGIDANHPLAAPVFAKASSYIDLYITPQLGHANKGTSEDYLVWITKTFSNRALQEGYELALEEMLGTTDYEFL